MVFVMVRQEAGPRERRPKMLKGEYENKSFLMQKYIVYSLHTVYQHNNGTYILLFTFL
jgi:hypothetical protein